MGPHTLIDFDPAWMTTLHVEAFRLPTSPTARLAGSECGTSWWHRYCSRRSSCRWEHR